MESHENKAVEFARSASLGLPGSIKDVADYLLCEGTGIESQTMAQVAAHTYVSKPTLVRFAKKAGYSGWTEYRHDFLVAMAQVEQERARREHVDVNHPFDDNASIPDVTSAMARIYQLAANEVESSVNHKALALAADAILAASHVVFLGAMQNYDRGRVFATNLGLMGVWCYAPRIGELGIPMRLLSSGDCAIAVSYSGDLQHQPMNLVPLLKDRGVSIVAVTNSHRSRLGSIAHHTLCFAPLEHLHDKVGPFYSGACTSLLLDMLYAACYARRYGQNDVQRTQVLGELHGLFPNDFA